jgi:hypothetical protein
MQCRPMQRNIGRAVTLLDLCAHRMQIGNLPAVPLAIVSRFGAKPTLRICCSSPSPRKTFIAFGLS